MPSTQLNSGMPLMVEASFHRRECEDVTGAYPGSCTCNVSEMFETLARAICCPLGDCYMEQHHGTPSECRACDWQAEAVAVEKLIRPIIYGLGCIANRDWKSMTAEQAREEARRALMYWNPNYVP